MAHDHFKWTSNQYLQILHFLQVESDPEGGVEGAVVIKINWTLSQMTKMKERERRRGRGRAATDRHTPD